MCQMHGYHFEIHKRADFHSNLFLSWELVTERPIKCAHFTHFKLKCMHFERPLPGMIIPWFYYFTSALSEDNVNNFVFATAASRNFFKMLKSTVSTIHKYKPNYKIYVYDLGLRNHQLLQVKFQFKKNYPEHAFSVGLSFLIQNTLFDEESKPHL